MPIRLIIVRPHYEMPTLSACSEAYDASLLPIAPRASRVRVMHSTLQAALVIFLRCATRFGIAHDGVCARVDLVLAYAFCLVGCIMWCGVPVSVLFSDRSFT